MADLANMKVKDLIAHAKAKNIKGYSGLRKEQLINLIQGKTVTRKPRAKRAAAAGRATGGRTPRAFKKELEGLTVKQIKDELRGAGAKLGGTKPELLRRLGYVRAGKPVPKTRSPRAGATAGRGGATRTRSPRKAGGSPRGRKAVGPTVKDLKAQAKAKNIKGYYKLNKADLLAALGLPAGGAAPAAGGADGFYGYARRRY